MITNRYKKRRNTLRKIKIALLVFFVIAIGAVIVKKHDSVAKEKSSPAGGGSVSVSQSPTESASAIADLSGLTWPAGVTVKAKVLMYHHIGSLPDNADDIRKGLTVSKDKFSAQVKYLKDNGYDFMTLEDLYRAVADNKPTEKIVAMTFDDGYQDNFTDALPVMNDYGVKGTFFIISGKIGQTDYMNTAQIKEISSAGNEIGSHTVSHPSLEKATPTNLSKEVNDSKTTLEALIGKKVYSFCYPSGKYSPEVIASVAKAGYLMAVTTAKGAPFPSGAPLEIPRYRINPTTNISSLF